MMKVLALGAHFDDVELGCGGALIKHARRGDEVTIFVVTDSAFRDPEGRLVRPEGIPSKEGRASADRIGAKLICGDFPTNNTLFDERLVVAVRRIVDKTPFDLVYTHWSGDVHLDHAGVARAALSAARHAPSLLMYRSNWYSGDRPFDGRFFVDISDVLDEKLALLRCYESEFKRCGETWEKFLRETHQAAGREIGAAYAEAFEIVRYRASVFD